MSDPVNSPSHYNQGAVEAIDAIASVIVGYDAIAAYMLGNVIKYIARAPFKGNAHEDLRKARWYFDRALEEMGVASAAPESPDQAHELTEYMRRHEAFKCIVRATEYQCREVFSSIYNLWVSGKLGPTRFSVKCLSDGKWEFSRILDGVQEKSTHTHDEIVELFERWAKPCVNKEEAEQ